jgi:hypothetical protein
MAVLGVAIRNTPDRIGLRVNIHVDRWILAMVAPRYPTVVA